MALAMRLAAMARGRCAVRCSSSIGGLRHRRDAAAVVLDGDRRRGAAGARHEATTLASGLRVVSQETFTYMSAMGLVVGAGSAHERAALGTAGGAQLAEVCGVAGATAVGGGVLRRRRSGAYLHANAQREQTLYCVDALRDNAVAAGELLAEAARTDLSAPRTSAKASLLLAWEDAPQDARVRELIHEAAYGRTSPLEAPLLTPPGEVAKLGALANFRSTLFGPDRMVLAGAGIDHATLVGIAETYFEPFVPPRGPAPPAAPSPYVGGAACEKRRRPRGALGRRRLVLSGRAGQGMYSRLYREVLNRHYWVEGAGASCPCTTPRACWGSWAPRPRLRHLTEVLAAHLLRVGAEPVKRDELDRAKNMLKVNVLTQLESRLVLFEDLGRQYATFGKRQAAAR
ncbi:hypothetical protein JL722_2150 [Aureococcus anophagefferens]|nr:hypothetical protein JL722_2150 [Aureococcus anophagefferens]